MLASGVLCKRDHLDPNRLLCHSDLLVMDFTLGHTYSSHHVLRKDTLQTLQDENVVFINKNLMTWAGRRWAFTVFERLVGNGCKFIWSVWQRTLAQNLCFLWALVNHAARSSVPVPQPIIMIPVLRVPLASHADQIFILIGSSWSESWNGCTSIVPCQLDAADEEWDTIP